jgi:predicted metal-dependent hydrolase
MDHRPPLQAELPLWSPLADEVPVAAGETLQRLLLGGEWVRYRLRRARGRRLALVVDAGGLRIGAPLSLPLADIEAFARSHRDWLAKKLAEWRRRPARTVVAVADGLSVPVFGRPVTLRLVSAPERIRWHDDALQLAPAAGESPAVLLERALRERARASFRPRLADFAARLGFPPPPLSIGAARTRWGSCSRSGIRLNWRLLHLRPEIVDYVIAHEVAHLREMNHSPRFWALVGALCPDYRRWRAALRDEADGLPVYR